MTTTQLTHGPLARRARRPHPLTNAIAWTPLGAAPTWAALHERHGVLLRLLEVEPGPLDAVGVLLVRMERTPDEVTRARLLTALDRLDPATPLGGRYLDRTSSARPGRDGRRARRLERRAFAYA